MTDIAPELFDNLQKSFESNLAADKKAAALLEKIDAGNGNYVIAGDYAERVGESLAKSFQTNLSSEVLPDGKMYYNIAEKTIKPLFEEEYGMVSKVAAAVQKFLNTKAGIGLNAVRAAYDSDAVKGIINKVCSYDQYDDAAWVLNDASVSFSRSVVDRTLKVNIDFQGKSGRSPKIVRRAGYNCCQWCADLEGTYEYPEIPEDVFRRHDNCRCAVDYDPGTGRVQNVHTKEWRDADERDRIEERKEFNLEKTRVDKEQLKNFNKTLTRSISADDFAIVTYGKGIADDINNTILETMKSCERKNGFIISEIQAKSINSSDGMVPVLQIEPTSFGLLQLNLNTDVLSGISLAEINEKFLNTESTVVNSLEEAVIHESGHAKLISGKTVQQIRTLYDKLGEVHIDGISELAYGDGVECIAELEVLRSRGTQVSKEAMEFYEKYMGGNYS